MCLKEWLERKFIIRKLLLALKDWVTASLVIIVTPCKSPNISILRIHTISVGRKIKPKPFLAPEKVAGLPISYAEDGQFV